MHTALSIDIAAKECRTHGADTVYVLDSEKLAMPRADLFSQVLVEKIKNEAPRLVLFTLTDLNREIAARSARKCGCGLIADCVDIKLEGDNIAATITPQHLLFNRNAMFQGGLRPHNYCLPVLKRDVHQQALLEVIRSGSNKFFLGTDSAPHSQRAKESACGCAGIFSAHAAIEIYTSIFEQQNALDKLEAFASFNGPDFYGLPRNQHSITLVKQDWKVPDRHGKARRGRRGTA